MNLIIAGDFEKHDLVISLGVMLQSHSEQQVVIVTDRNRNYHYFNGNIENISIQDQAGDAGDITIYDWHSSQLPTVAGETKYILATNYEKPALEAAIQLQNHRHFNGLLVVEQECSITMKYIMSYFKTSDFFYEYWDNPQRRVDLVHEGRLDTVDQDKDFSNSINNIMVQLLGIPKNDIKPLRNFIKKRG